MLRAISVVLAVLVLLGVGWYFGHRPLRVLEERHAMEATAWRNREADLLQKAGLSEARGMLRLAEAELLVASSEAKARNFGVAGSRTRKAQDLIVQAAGIPGTALELGPIRDQVEAAHAKVEAMDPGSPDLLRFAADELRRILERVGRG